AVAFALAAVVVPSLPRRWQPVIWIIAVVVAFGRVYGGAHLPLDVVGGAGLGLLVGTLSRWVFGLGGEGLPRRAAGPGRVPRAPLPCPRALSSDHVVLLEPAEAQPPRQDRQPVGGQP